MASAVGWARMSQFLFFTWIILSMELLAMPSYFSRCSSSRVFIFIIAPSFSPTTNYDSFLLSLSIIEVGKLGSFIRWNV
jgi:hypothetical protein